MRPNKQIGNRSLIRNDLAPMSENTTLRRHQSIALTANRSGMHEPGGCVIAFALGLPEGACMRSLRAIGIAAALAVTVSSAHATPILTFSGSTITGASGIEVNGISYNVSLKTGACEFTECFPFSPTDSFTAMTELQSLIDTSGYGNSLGAFFDCSLAVRCSLVLPFYRPLFITPQPPNPLDPNIGPPPNSGGYIGYADNLVIVIGGTLPIGVFIQEGLIGDPEAGFCSVLPNSSLISCALNVELAASNIIPAAVYATWTPSDVPEPSTLALFGFGILGLAGVRALQSRKSGPAFLWTAPLALFRRLTVRR
jgi:hypothetical protein